MEFLVHLLIECRIQRTLHTRLKEKKYLKIKLIIKIAGKDESFKQNCLF